MSGMPGPVIIRVFLQYQHDRDFNCFTCLFIAECTLVLAAFCGKKKKETGLGSRGESIFAAPCNSDRAHEGKENLLWEAFVVEQEENERFSKQNLQNKSKLQGLKEQWEADLGLFRRGGKKTAFTSL